MATQKKHVLDFKWSKSSFYVDSKSFRNVDSTWHMCATLQCHKIKKYINRQIHQVVGIWYVGSVNLTWSTQTLYLSVIAVCSNIAEPVLVFQFPDIDFRLRNSLK